MNNHRSLLICASLAGATAVILGAFGAHGLKPKLTPEALATFEAGARYQLIHAIAIWAAVQSAVQRRSKAPLIAGWLWIAGVVLFSGSLYLLSTRTLLGIEHWRWLGPVTPLGGLCFIAGWLTLLVSAIRK